LTIDFQKRVLPMGIASYEIIRNGNAWAVDHDGQTGGEYATKEAAFEAIIGVASNAIKAGHELRIHVPGSDGQSNLGHR
jgi:hypothetical protein